MADGGDNLAGAGPVWERRGRRSGSNPFVGLIVTLLALFGALMLGLSVAGGSVASAGGRVDGWISAGWNMVTGGNAADAAAEAAGDATEAAGNAAEEAGDAVEQGADRAAEELKGG